MDEPRQRPPVVVGVDGANHTRAAIDWAAREALLREVPVRVVHAYMWPLLRIPPALASLGPADGLREHANDLLAESIEVAQFAAPGVAVQSYMQTDFPEDLLASESRDALYLVLGSRGLGRVGRLVAGSTTTQLVRRAKCPVAVVGYRGPTPRTHAPVIVGVDGSIHSATALSTAVDLALHYETELHVVHVSSGQHPDIDGMVAPWRANCPNVSIRVLLLDGRPGEVLVELSRVGRALVVGSRGSGGISGALLGSIAQTMLVRSRCPVIVAPAGLPD